ncbi:hypothetical protein SporoS204_12595 [Sporosarcina ureae]|uniref:Uncharacterized protein n=1 Tax=Sporosarcina ureae TaxID=1571 RepID=A0ABM6JY25_SPOUR|nr:hypothetical protein SporoS204_12595 [Sporosarcina ureae]
MYTFELTADLSATGWLKVMVQGFNGFVVSDVSMIARVSDGESVRAISNKDIHKMLNFFIVFVKLLFTIQLTLTIKSRRRKE